MKRIKGYIFIDLDGTLIDEKLEINRKDIESIHEAIYQGYDVVLISGRPTPFVRWIKDKVHKNLNVIGFNGAVVNDTAQGFVSQSTINELLMKDYSIILKNEDGYFSNIRNIPKGFRYDMLDNYPRIYKRISDVLKVLIWVDKDQFYSVKQELEELSGFTMFSYVPKGFELVGEDIDKKSAILEYVQKDIKIYSIGNDVNDISMFEVSDQYFVVGNILEGHQVKNVSEAIHVILKGGI